jgi:hypothetical protein
MEPGGIGGIKVARTLPIDGALLGDTLLRLRRDAEDATVRWNLGERGAVEIEANFVSDGPAWRASGRIWDRSGLALAAVAWCVEPRLDDDIELTVTPSGEVSPWWQSRVPDLLDLMHAAVNELAEELLWHAARAGVRTVG